ncbi:MAG: hypothetical protein HQ519_12970 [Planctomycetes bacterium]|nr:hypothetical protein [Planctomycetota bacterium]
MRSLLVVLASLVLSNLLHGQIFEVKFKTDKDAKKYAKYMVDIEGTPRFIAELRSGLTKKPSGDYTWDSAQRSEWFIADPDDPLSLPYKVKDGARGKANKKQVVGIQNSHLDGLKPFAQNNSFYGISLEYKDRMARMDELRELRDSSDKGGKEWMAAHWVLLDGYESMHMWLSGMGYPGAAKKLKKESDRQRKVVAKEAEEEQRKRAIQGVGKVEVPSKLNADAERLGLKTRFKMQQSQHFRITYHTGIKDTQVVHCLKLAERCLAGFRAQFVEPYLAEDFQDLIPDNLWLEWHFGPDNTKVHTLLYEEHYGMSWGPRKEERMKLHGSRNYRGGENPLYLCYWRIENEGSLSGIITSNLGTISATVHFRTANTQVSVDWLEQAMGYWMSLEFLGRNSVTEKAFDWGVEDDDHTVSRREDDKKDKETVAEPNLSIGEKRLYLESALAEGVPFNVLIQTQLFDMKRGDVAKSWAMYDFLTRTYGREAQVFLRDMGKFAREGGPFQEKVRKAGDAALKNSGQDLFRMLDEAWKEHALKELGRGQ